jgi:NADH:ubiquinone oxidoreductase subunit E
VRSIDEDFVEKQSRCARFFLDELDRAPLRRRSRLRFAGNLVGRLQGGDDFVAARVSNRPKAGRSRREVVVPFTLANLNRAREIIGQYPVTRSALLPLLHLAQDQDGWVTPDAMEEIAALLEITTADVLGTCSFYTMFKREPVGKLVVSVCTNVTCLVTGGPEILHHLERRYMRGELEARTISGSRVAGVPGA